MTTSARLIEINKYRKQMEMTPWRKVWTVQDQADWAGSIFNELDDEVQKQMMDLFGGVAALPCYDDIDISACSSEYGQGKLPIRRHEHDAGLDLFGNRDYVVSCWGLPTKVHTGYNFKIPLEWWDSSENDLD